VSVTTTMPPMSAHGSELVATLWKMNAGTAK
jgi:hypothetical protein